MDKDAIAQGKTVISFDLEGANKRKGGSNINHIDAIKDGIGLSLFATTDILDEPNLKVRWIANISDLLSGSMALGCQQAGALRAAIEYALENKEDYVTEMDAIAHGLKGQQTATANGVYNKLWPLLCSNIFRKSGKSIKRGVHNVYALGGIATSIQIATVELILGILWNQIRNMEGLEEELVIVIDEFQRLNLKKSSILMEMLHEARGYGVLLILATQSVGRVPSNILHSVFQSGVSLFFKPGATEIEKVAKIIDTQNPERYILMLEALGKGQSVATGCVTVDGKETNKPLLIRSEYMKNKPVLGARPMLIHKV